MIRSIRALLLSWYTLILVVTLSVFAAVLYRSRDHALFGKIDDRIRTHATAIAAASEDDAEDGIEIELTEDYLGAFRSGLEGAPYFLVWDGEGRVALSSDPELELPQPESAGFRDRDSRREFAAAGQDGLFVLVGQDTASERRELQRFLGLLIAAGLGVLALALVGGWFLAGQVLAPIHRISRAASEISATNLCRRIDVGKTETELGRLAATINDAFDRLQGAIERQSRFTADASHELRTPISVVLTLSEQTLARDREAPEYRQALEAVLRAARRMKNIVEGLLTLTRADAGELSLNREDVELADLIDETIELLQPLAAEHRVTLRHTGPRVRLHADPERLREVFANLISNGILYNRAGGEVSVEVRKAEGRIDVTVIDTGRGIPREHLPHLFERLYRVDPARTREVGGAGLGLAIARSIVESHGGSVSVESREGQGSTFTVSLPTSEA